MIQNPPIRRVFQPGQVPIRGTYRPQVANSGPRMHHPQYLQQVQPADMLHQQNYIQSNYQVYGNQFQVYQQQPGYQPQPQQSLYVYRPPGTLLYLLKCLEFVFYYFNL